VSKRLLDVEGLHTSFHTSDGVVSAVDGVSVYVDQGETLAIVGESGSGKSVTALSVMRLIASPPGEVTAMRVSFDGLDLFALPEEEMRHIRGSKLSMVFQEPMTSLNPVLPVGFQIAEPLEIHQEMTRSDALDKATEMLRLVGIPMAEQRAKDYPHQLSGGMRQRVMIGMALACGPKLLIADEPTTALDVTIQAQILDLMRKLKSELGMAMILITHDLGVVAEMAQRVVVMYAGQVVEEALVLSLFSNPRHPYTAGLMKSIPSIDRRVAMLHVIRGTVPSPMFYPRGCRFSPRCPYAAPKCWSEAPSLEASGERRFVRCWYPLGAEEVRP
jgi:oligopeptide transport system ATP-binding protein